MLKITVCKTGIDVQSQHEMEEKGPLATITNTQTEKKDSSYDGKNV